MDIPTMAGALTDPVMREKAEKQAERLLEELKKSVEAEVKDLGTLRKELRITVPAKIIGDHIAHNYDEIMHDVVVPGFRKGHAPRQLVEKRFAGEVRDSLKTAIVGQSFYAAAEKVKIEVLGDPLFRIESKDGVKLMDFAEAMQHITLPEKDDFTYTCELEVRPDFELPELKGVSISEPKIDINDKVVDEHILRQRKIRGRYEPSQTASDADALIIADVVLYVDGAEIKREDNVQLGVRGTRLDGVLLPKLDETLTGAKPGEQRTTECTIPDDYERADLRGKPGRFEFTIHEVKELIPLDEAAHLQQMGVADEKELREVVLQELEDERQRMVTGAKKTQVLEYLDTHTKLDLPPGLSARMIDRAVMRRVVELAQQGVPWGEIEAHIDELRTSARGRVQHDLKLEFILAKVAEKLEVEVTDEEVNTEIARLARVYSRRFDRVRDDLQQRGLLPQLAEQIRQDKCVDLILADAKVS